MTKLTISAKDLMEAEVSENEAQKLAKSIEDAVRKIFPKSFVDARFKKTIGSSIWLTFALGKDRSEWTSGIINNDPAHHSFNIWLDRSEGSLPEIMTLERQQGNISTKPPEGSHYAMGTHKVSFRKAKGDSKKMVAAVTRYFKKLKDELKKVEDDIYQYDLKGKF